VGIESGPDISEEDFDTYMDEMIEKITIVKF